MHDTWDYPYNNVAYLELAKSAGVGNSVCFPNKDTHGSCYSASNMIVYEYGKSG